MGEECPGEILGSAAMSSARSTLRVAPDLNRPRLWGDDAWAMLVSMYYAPYGRW